MSRRLDLGLLAFSSAALLASAVWVLFFTAPLDGQRATLQPSKIAARSEWIREPNTWQPKLSSWSPPQAQSRGEQWTYEVFTPPEIFYDTVSQQFTVSPPTIVLEREIATVGSPEIPELRLIGVSRPLFRLQLIGFVKSGTEDIGLFENVASTEIFLAGQGKQLTELHLEIEELQVLPSPIALPESMTSYQTIARAVVRDQQTGESVTLSSVDRRLSSHSQAILLSGDSPSDQRHVIEGDIFDVGNVRYEVGEILAAPPTVALTRRPAVGGVAERRILQVSEVAANSVKPPSI